MSLDLKSGFSLRKKVGRANVLMFNSIKLKKVKVSAIVLDRYRRRCRCRRRRRCRVDLYPHLTITVLSPIQKNSHTVQQFLLAISSPEQATGLLCKQTTLIP